MNDDVDERLRWVLAIALGSILIGGTADLVMDKPVTWLSFHVIFETLMIAGALVMATTLWLGWWRSAHATFVLRATMEAQREEREAWRASAEAALEGLGHAIDAQFRTWRLTPTESAVALMLLKGYGHKQIAAFTGRSERTVRQHAGVVYDKAGIVGRAELAAFFLHGLMLPSEKRAAANVASTSTAAMSSDAPAETTLTIKEVHHEGLHRRHREADRRQSCLPPRALHREAHAAGAHVPPAGRRHRGGDSR